MQLHPGRILGIVVGLVILAAIFLLPFGSGNSTLYGTVWPWISNLGQVQGAGNARMTYDYIWITAFILLVIAGLVGIFPLGTGVLGVVGMALITVSSYLVYPSGSHTLSTGPGFYVIWVASIVALGASFWHGKKREVTSPVSVTVTQTQNIGAPVTQMAQTTKCPGCGTENPVGVTKCSKCGMDLARTK